MGCTISTLDYDGCDENEGGLGQYAMGVPWEDIDDTALPSTDADGLTVSAPIVLKALKAWHKVYLTTDTGKHTDTLVGESDGKSFEQLFEGFHPGAAKEAAIYFSTVKNKNMLYAVQDLEGRWRLIGIQATGAANAIRPLKLLKPAKAESAVFDSGAATADRKGTTFSFKAAAGHMALYYESTFDESIVT